MVVSIVATVFSLPQKMFPGADIVSSTFDAFAAEVAKVPPGVLPVITSEIGDTWIYGVPSDPRKCARVHAALDIRADCIAAGECDAVNDYRVWDFSRLALKNGEHTWGLDCKTNMPNHRYEQVYFDADADADACERDDAAAGAVANDD